MVKTFTIEEVQAILNAVTFAPSCVDMGWKWEVRECPGAVQNDITEGFLIRTSFQRPDRDTGVIARGMGSWHHLPLDSTRTSIVKRAFVAAEAILRHELMESFRYNGARIFDPHHTLADLCAAVDHHDSSRGMF